MRLFYLLFSIYGISHIYIFLCLRRAFGGGKWQIPVGLWLFAMAVSWLWRFSRPVGSFGAKVQDVTFFWMGFLILLCYCLIAGDLAALAARGLALLTRAEAVRQAAAFLTAARYVPAALGIAFLLYGWSIYRAYTPRIVSLALTTAKLPAGSAPLRIVGISDVHVSSIIGPFLLQRIADKVNALRPDVLVVAGDLVDTDVSKRNKDAAILASISAPHGKFVVTGNHEYYRGLRNSLDFMKRSGLTPLRGAVAEAGGISVAGVDDDSFSRESPDTTDVQRVLAMAPEDRFILLLNHKPHYPLESIGHFDLQYSGHTHAGQFWPGIFFIRRMYGLDQGLTLLNRGKASSLLYITNGTGFWGPPIRFLTPSEITLITLSPEKSGPEHSQTEAAPGSMKSPRHM